MIYFLRTLFCNHQYSVIRIINVYDNDTNKPYKTIWVQRCEKCGKIKKTSIC